MSRLFITALLGSAVFVGLTSGVALAQESVPGVKPCIGELCPPKAPKQDMPDQKPVGDQGQQSQNQEQSVGQAKPPKKKRVANQQTYAGKARRINCDEGRAIIARRFHRVRIIECRGRTYTYGARRDGEAFQVSLNSRTGRVAAVRVSRRSFFDSLDIF